MDTIFITGIRIFGHHGHTPEEQQIGQTIEVDVELRMDLSEAGSSDKLQDTADWCAAYAIISDLVANTRHSLMEHLAAEVAQKLLVSTPTEEVLVRVSKITPPLGGIVQKCGVEIVRKR